MNFKERVLAIPLTNIASSTLSGSYQAINSSGLPVGITRLRLVSTSSTAVTVSYDGTTDHDFLSAGATIDIPTQSNALPRRTGECSAFFVQGTVVYVKGTAGTGNIYLAGYYQPVI